jgi:ABC-2 type transport system ATP-binding protein
MISLTNISKQFNGVVAVKKISLDIEPGEIVGLLGPNGAGKTTTLRILAGVLPPSSGRVRVDGKNFEEHDGLLKQTIGYMPENNPLYEELTVEEHLQFWGKVKGIAPEAMAEAIEYAVEKTGIAEVYYRLIGELSKGYRQRVGLAQAILGKPKILILDEPTEGLDPNQRREIQALLNELKESRTVIVSSHVLGEVAKIASRVVIIHQGSVVGDDTPQRLVHVGEGKQVVRVEIKGTGVKKELAALKGVDKVVDDGAGWYTLNAAGKKDIRESVYALAVKRKWTLLTLMQVERQLEDVFSELTQE